MVNQIDKDDSQINDEIISCAFVKKEKQVNDNFSTDIFSVYGSDGILLAAFDTREAAIAAIMQSGLQYMSLH